MNTYVLLIRGINVGGKNKILMADLKKCLEDLECSHVLTYIASGNVILKSNKSADGLTSQIETILPKAFKLDSKLIKVLALTQDELQAIVDNKPSGFGDQPEKYYSDVIFLIGINADKAFSVFSPREGVDTVWTGSGVIYSQRLGALRTRSKLSKIVGTHAYKSMTIRNWNTTIKLLEMVKKLE